MAMVVHKRTLFIKQTVDQIWLENPSSLMPSSCVSGHLNWGQNKVRYVPGGKQCRTCQEAYLVGTKEGNAAGYSR